jgi:hypothetical protein
VPARLTLTLRDLARHFSLAAGSTDFSLWVFCEDCGVATREPHRLKSVLLESTNPKPWFAAINAMERMVVVRNTD